MLVRVRALVCVRVCEFPEIVAPVICVHVRGKFDSSE